MIIFTHLYTKPNALLYVCCRLVYRSATRLGPCRSKPLFLLKMFETGRESDVICFGSVINVTDVILRHCIQTTEMNSINYNV